MSYQPVTLESYVTYQGDLLDGWSHAGKVNEITENGEVATVEFGDQQLQDIPVTELKPE